MRRPRRGGLASLDSGGRVHVATDISLELALPFSEDADQSIQLDDALFLR